MLAKAGVSTAVLQSLIKKNILIEYEEQILRLQSSSKKLLPPKKLTESQQQAFENIINIFEKKDVALLFGVTSSGKTEIYIHLIKKYTQIGKQVLYLLPEIALTSQIINRLKQVFGDEVGIYHSKFNDSERSEIFRSVSGDFLGRHYKVILGVRSALFLPFQNLGLIIVDEEHENTFKQYDPAPRYYARDAAIMLAKLSKAKVLLGSATPSIESYFNALNGKYGLVQLKHRYGNVRLPEIILADERKARENKQMKSLFHPLMLKEIAKALSDKEQVIIFRNRRGFAPYLECRTCGWIPKCDFCDVSMTYHSDINMLVCHYCGYKKKIPAHCEVCGDRAMETRSFGTQKIEEELQIFFPQAKIARLDSDTTRKKYAHEQIISNFEKKDIDILVGTQMITKGLDFENVSIVGIINADNMLFFPDFRSNEKTFQLLTQVSGRAGRKNKQGKVIIQTSHPEHQILQFVKSNDYQKMYQTEIADRKKFGYPPFVRLIKIVIRHKKENYVNDFSTILASKLREKLGKRVLGPQFPVIKRIQNLYNKEILIKIEKKLSLQKVKKFITEETETLKNYPNFSTINVYFNVDPL